MIVRSCAVSSTGALLRAFGKYNLNLNLPVQGGDYRILCVSERFLSLILLGGEILRAAAEITCSQSWDYRLRSQKEQLLGKAECLANCSVCIGLL